MPNTDSRSAHHQGERDSSAEPFGLPVPASHVRPLGENIAQVNALLEDARRVHIGVRGRVEVHPMDAEFRLNLPAAYWGQCADSSTLALARWSIVREFVESLPARLEAVEGIDSAITRLRIEILEDVKPRLLPPIERVRQDGDGVAGKLHWRDADRAFGDLERYLSGIRDRLLRPPASRPIEAAPIVVIHQNWSTTNVLATHEQQEPPIETEAASQDQQEAPEAAKGARNDHLKALTMFWEKGVLTVEVARAWRGLRRKPTSKEHKDTYGPLKRFVERYPKDVLRAIEKAFGPVESVAGRHSYFEPLAPLLVGTGQK